MGLGVKTNQRAVMISCAVWTGTSRVLNTDHFQASVEIKLPFCSSFGSPQCWINVCHEDEKFPSKSRTYSKAILLFSFWLIHCWRLFESCIVNYFFWLNVFLILWRKLKFFFFFFGGGGVLLMLWNFLILFYDWGIKMALCLYDFCPKRCGLFMILRLAARHVQSCISDV